VKPTKEVEKDIYNDLFSSPADRVIYVEGKFDPEFFFGLLGVPQPTGAVFLHKGTLVKEPTDGSGKKAVERYVTVGQSKFSGRVFGIVDGDGESLITLAPKFDPPHPGPLFTWKGYSIESLFPQLSWPTGVAWQAAPDWQVELASYAPYVAMNRLRRILDQRIETLELHKFRKPMSGKSLVTITDAEAALNRDKGLLLGFDVAVEFVKEANAFSSELSRSLDAGLAMFDGKWLLDHFLVERLGKNPDYWRREWIKHAESIGGLQAVRDLWQRITGSPP
jgi:hypothetical protein